MARGRFLEDDAFASSEFFDDAPCGGAQMTDAGRKRRGRPEGRFYAPSWVGGPSDRSRARRFAPTVSPSRAVLKVRSCDGGDLDERVPRQRDVPVARHDALEAARRDGRLERRGSGSPILTLKFVTNIFVTNTL